MQTTPSKLQLTPTKITPTKISPARAQNTPIKITIQPTSAALSPTKMSSAPSLATLGFTYSPVKEDTEETARAAIQVLQTLSETEFLDMISCFVRVCWSAAAGKLHLASAPGSSALAKDQSGELGPTGNGNLGGTLFNPAGRRSKISCAAKTFSSRVKHLNFWSLALKCAVQRNWPHFTIFLMLKVCNSVIKILFDQHYEPFF